MDVYLQRMSIRSSNFYSPGRSTIESLGLVATSVQEVVSDSGNKSAILDTLLMELEVHENY